MVDLSQHTIKRLLDRQLLQMTTKTILSQLSPKEDSFDLQFSRGWER